MLSINIPVYNIEVSDLVRQLKEQADTLSVDYDIRVYDDSSEEKFKERNRWVRELSNIIYLELDKNIGRSAIRNKMGFDSKRRYQLFIDADSRLVNDRFLKNYIEHAKSGCIISGGTSYSDSKPGDCEKMLRWKYGRMREAVPAKIRAGKKGFIISSNNFFIESDLFKKIHFREEIISYGHEDTLLGFDLFNYGAEPLHIDNPVEHTGIEDSAVFLMKTRDAMKNLLFISKTAGTNASALKSRISFLNAYNMLTQVIPPSMIKWIFIRLSNVLESNLTGKNPQLFIFDLYKLGYYAQISLQEINR
jgi:hypothetical protein